MAKHLVLIGSLLLLCSCAGREGILDVADDALNAPRNFNSYRSLMDHTALALALEENPTTRKMINAPGMGLNASLQQVDFPYEEDSSQASVLLMSYEERMKEENEELIASSVY